MRECWVFSSGWKILLFARVRCCDCRDEYLLAFSCIGESLRDNILYPVPSPSRRLYPPACKPCGLEAEPEAIDNMSSLSPLCSASTLTMTGSYLVPERKVMFRQNPNTRLPCKVVRDRIIIVPIALGFKILPWTYKKALRAGQNPKFETNSNTKWQNDLN